MTSRIELNHGWEFRRLHPAVETWRPVELPHSPFVADPDGQNHWFGLCEYRRPLQWPQPLGDQRCVLYIGAAMHTAHVFVDGREVAVHRGGYLPFEVDLTDSVRSGTAGELMLQLDNRDDPEVPPGKPFDELDFCWFGGLYRGAELRIKPALHITDPVGAGQVASGGVFIRTLSLTDSAATIAVKTQLRNTGRASGALVVRTDILHRGTKVASALSPQAAVASGQAIDIEQTLTIAEPARWSPDAPHLHEARVTVQDEHGTELDGTTVRFGIRRIGFSRSGGFVINGRRMRLRGTNRHQEMPGVGYAVPRAAQFRDARRIKDAGFDYVRLAHYPQSPDFLDACDELGLVVMTGIPGWQFIGNAVFRELCCQVARDLIRRDRNHPCVVLWELSLNETAMDDAFMARLHAIGHEEYPGDQMFTCGWIDRYDVFIHSRQHGRIHTWQNGDKALVIAEYGDWEYYARDEGFDQKTGAGVFDRWSTARQFRRDGERGLSRQVLNHTAALNDTLASPAVLDGQWAIFDYARGYDPVRAAAGILDVFRLPKFSYHFYRSQRDPDTHDSGSAAKPMVFIASHWLPGSNLRVTIFSNCEKVELKLNGIVVGRQRPAQTHFTQNLPHAPFYFHLPCFTPGVLEATGYIDGQPHATHAVATPGAPHQLQLTIDDLGVSPAGNESDVLLAHARVVDASGRLCVESSAPVTFALTGAELWAPAEVNAEAGIGSTVVRVPSDAPGFELRARAMIAAKLVGAVVQWRRPEPRAGRTTLVSLARSGP